MKVPPSADKPHLYLFSPEEQAEALWIYIQARSPRFTMDAARDVVKRLELHLGEVAKVAAKRLCNLLKIHRVTLEHANALHAVSHMTGHTSWHRHKSDEPHNLKFVTFNVDSVKEQHLKTWDDLAVELRTWVDRLIISGQLPLAVLKLNFTGKVLNFSTPVLPAADDKQQGNQFWPLGSVVSLNNDIQWLEGAPAALEKLRRHVEENGHAVLDGYAVLRLCANFNDHLEHPIGVGISDVVNSELVLMREDSEDDPQSAFEIARGDELTCWHQFELSLRNSASHEMPHLQVTVPDEGTGAWQINGSRYVWMVETLKPQAFFPGLVNRQIGVPDCQRLLRRYKLAKRIHGGTFKHYDHGKQLDYLSGPPETYRVDLHFLLRQLKDAELTWEDYLEKFDVERRPMADELPVGFVFELLEHLQIEEPSQILARPNISEMQCVDDGRLLRTLSSRVEHVRYAAPPDLNDSEKSDLRLAIEEFATGMQMQRLLASGGMQIEEELPHFVWATEADDLRLSAEAMDLSLYVATIPHIFSTKGVVADIPGVKTWPWALGNAVFLRFVRAGRMS